MGQLETIEGNARCTGSHPNWCYSPGAETVTIRPSRSRQHKEEEKRRTGVEPIEPSLPPELLVEGDDTPVRRRQGSHGHRGYKSEKPLPPERSEIRRAASASNPRTYESVAIWEDGDIHVPQCRLMKLPAREEDADVAAPSCENGLHTFFPIVRRKVKLGGPRVMCYCLRGGSPPVSGNALILDSSGSRGSLRGRGSPAWPVQGLGAEDNVWLGTRTECRWDRGGRHVMVLKPGVLGVAERKRVRWVQVGYTRARMGECPGDFQRVARTAFYCVLRSVPSSSDVPAWLSG
ncbi:hypothetical protein EDB83DRAFT_2319361 [Lactarius deliciosus]|nr:hypothetical protein EDB83DRAFT_2319361 [Lactarius deliciosus]